MLVKMVLPALIVLGIIIIIVIGMGRRKRRQQDRLARETARRLYGVGRPRDEPKRTFLLNMRAVIDKFKAQRFDDEYQFAVLFFVQEEIKKLEDIHIDSNYVFRNSYRNGLPLCNYEQTFWPDPEKFHNYMVSRHKNPKHAEEIILDRFPRLWRKYLEIKRGKKPSYVILYSWLMLCSKCTRKLISMMKDDYKPTKFVVVYTVSAWKGESEQTAEMSRNKLLSAGIRVYRVDYEEYLPPGEQPGDQQAIEFDFDNEQEFPPLIQN